MNFIVGGWTVYEEISNEQMSAFKEAMKGMAGVNYEPKIVATQLVSNGMNYCFICTSELVIPESNKGLAKVCIYKELGHNKLAVITKIEQII